MPPSLSRWPSCCYRPCDSEGTAIPGGAYPGCPSVVSFAPRLLDACRRSRNPALWHVFALALNTGMRQGEILGLEWDRINLSTATITLRRTTAATQKGRKRRGLPINDAVYQILIALQPDAEKSTGRLFRPGKSGSQIRTAWNTALRRAGITNFTFHGLRHTAASYLMMNGATLQEVQQILGHSDLPPGETAENELYVDYPLPAPGPPASARTPAITR